MQSYSDSTGGLWTRVLLLVVGLLFPLHLPYSLGSAADAEKLLGWWASPRSDSAGSELVVVRTLWHASNSGLLPGDVVLELNDAPATPERLAAFRTSAKPGDVATLTVLRDGKTLTANVPVRMSSPSYAGYRWYRVALAAFAWLVGMILIARRTASAEALLLGGALLLIGPVTVPVAFANDMLVLRFANGIWHLAGGIYRFLLPILLLLFFLCHSSKRDIVQSRWVKSGLLLSTAVLSAIISKGFTSPLAWTMPGLEIQVRAVAGLIAELLAVIGVFWIARDFRKMPEPVRWVAFAFLLILSSGAVLSVAMIAVPHAVTAIDALRQVKALTFAVLPIAAALYLLLSASADQIGSWHARVRASNVVSAFLSLLYGCAVAGAAAITLSIFGLSLKGAEVALFGAIILATIVFAPVLQWSREMVDRHVFSGWISIEQKAHALVQELHGELEPRKLAERVRNSLPEILDVRDVELVLANELVKEWYPGSDIAVAHAPRDELQRRLAEHEGVSDRQREPVRNSSGALIGLLAYTMADGHESFAPPEQRSLAAVVQGVSVALRNSAAYFDLQRANQELAENERVTSLAVMAGGLAHEIKNPLASLKMGLYLLHRESPEDNRLLRIEGDVRRIDDLVSSLLRFTHNGNPETREPIEITEAIRSIVADLSTLARDRDIRIEQTYPDETICVLASSSELRVLVSSIVHNALDACLPGGVVIVSVTGRDEEVEISISDNGRGIPGTLRRRVFDLNFSTKQGGSGLGLALARREAERLGGSIEMESTPGHGTTMLVRLPAAQNVTAGGNV
jgi:signal transduction histidine kinase